MKKIKLNAAKLQLNREKITELNTQQMAQIKGGFTYALSWGAVCKISHKLGQGTPAECGIAISNEQY